MIGDLGGEQRPGVAITSEADGSFTGSVSVFVKDKANGAFKLTTLDLPAPDSGPVDLAIGNLTNDGLPDLIAADTFSGTASLFTNTTHRE